MTRITLVHEDLLACIDQLHVFKLIQVDEHGRDQRPRMPALVSLKVARLTDELENKARVLNKELKGLAMLYITTNATGQQLPVLQPVEVKSATCPHDPAHLAPLARPGVTQQWECSECKTRFVPQPQLGFMLTNGAEYHKRREELLSASCEVEVHTLTEAEVSQFPDCPPGSLQALLPFIDKQPTSRAPQTPGPTP